MGPEGSRFISARRGNQSQMRTLTADEKTSPQKGTFTESCRCCQGCEAQAGMACVAR